LEKVRNGGKIKDGKLREVQEERNIEENKKGYLTFQEW